MKLKKIFLFQFKGTASLSCVIPIVIFDPIFFHPITPFVDFNLITPFVDFYPIRQFVDFWCELNCSSPSPLLSIQLPLSLSRLRACRSHENPSTGKSRGEGCGGGNVDEEDHLNSWFTKRPFHKTNTTVDLMPRMPLFIPCRALHANLYSWACLPLLLAGRLAYLPPPRWHAFLLTALV